jgi:hypothetical protein
VYKTRFIDNNLATVKNLHLIVSVILIIPIALVYGLYPNVCMPILFNFKVETINLTSVFRAMMGLYIGVSIIWVVGIAKPKFWFSATLTNIFFMGGLSLGRLLSLAWDGVPSIYFLIGLALELTLACWGLTNLKKYPDTSIV